ncbi:MAG TPA: hypothetical protein VJB11_00110 [archaeon]|nr:hypothetical protein [archaeon]
MENNVQIVHGVRVVNYMENAREFLIKEKGHDEKAMPYNHEEALKFAKGRSNHINRIVNALNSYRR